jgi:MFS family permease
MAHSYSHSNSKLLICELIINIIYSRITGLGLGIGKTMIISFNNLMFVIFLKGITDAAILPLLAHLVDTRHGTASYGSIYALSQTAVCLAYSLGPLIGGQLAEHLGFSALFRIIGFANILYCPMCLALKSGVDDRMMIVGRKMLDNEMEEKVSININNHSYLLTFSMFYILETECERTYQLFIHSRVH